MPTWELLVGPASALVLALLILYATFQLGIIVPGKVYEAAVARADALDEENAKQNEAIKTFIREVGKLETQNARLEEQVKHLTEEVESLKGTNPKGGGAR